MNPRWFKDHVAYTMAKYGMSMCILGMAEEFRDDGIACNALWPRTGKCGLVCLFRWMNSLGYIFTLQYTFCSMKKTRLRRITRYIRYVFMYFYLCSCNHANTLKLYSIYPQKGLVLIHTMSKMDCRTRVTRRWWRYGDMYGKLITEIGNIVLPTCTFIIIAGVVVQS